MRPLIRPGPGLRLGETRNQSADYMARVSACRRVGRCPPFACPSASPGPSAHRTLAIASRGVLSGLPLSRFPLLASMSRAGPGVAENRLDASRIGDELVGGGRGVRMVSPSVALATGERSLPSRRPARGQSCTYSTADCRGRLPGDEVPYLPCVRTPIERVAPSALGPASEAPLPTLRPLIRHAAGRDPGPSRPGNSTRLPGAGGGRYRLGGSERLPRPWRRADHRSGQHPALRAGRGRRLPTDLAVPP